MGWDLSKRNGAGHKGFVTDLAFHAAEQGEPAYQDRSAGCGDTQQACTYFNIDGLSVCMVGHIHVQLQVARSGAGSSAGWLGWSARLAEPRFAALAGAGHLPMGGRQAR
ncbi:hypothetical protein PHLH8_31910 [Pseudomonas sp. Pc102]|uniref:hypothetical protein n=1 Tax=Pseudomonas sp. Pc102 TaxID=2678261 RepID=UPI001BCF10DC|nr:hypothetical protein [Pseudomonas sp. Pc102]BBP83549.1 hypothetical protein PHLH8_31910 [Pseudomonas sp. Pc102]